MDSKEALVKLLKENEAARESFMKLSDVPEEEAEKELIKFEKEFDIELKKEDFADQELDDGQLEGVVGGSVAADVIGVVTAIYGIIDRPDATKRATTSGSKRFK
jgi:hypothetical protein